MTNLSERIKEERSKRGLSLDKLSKQSGVSKTYLSELESGSKTNPSVDVLLKIALSLNVPLDYLLHGKKEESLEDRPIPESLREFAMEADLKFSEVDQLMKHGNIALARRGKKPEGEQVSKDAWKKLYETLKSQDLI